MHVQTLAAPSCLAILGVFDLKASNPRNILGIYRRWQLRAALPSWASAIDSKPPRTNYLNQVFLWCVIHCSYLLPSSNTLSFSQCVEDLKDGGVYLRIAEYRLDVRRVLVTLSIGYLLCWTLDTPWPDPSLPMTTTTPRLFALRRRLRHLCLSVHNYASALTHQSTTPVFSGTSSRVIRWIYLCYDDLSLLGLLRRWQFRPASLSWTSRIVRIIGTCFLELSGFVLTHMYNQQHILYSLSTIPTLLVTLNRGSCYLDFESCVIYTCE